MERHALISRDGTSIACFVEGAGPPLLLVHGMTFDHETAWARLARRLRGEVRLCSMDRRGRGASGDAPSYSFAREVEDVAGAVAWWAGKAGEPVHLLAHSFGGTIALDAVLACRSSDLASVMLYEPSISTFDPWPVGAIERMERWLADGEREVLLRFFFCEVMGMEGRTFGALRAMPSWEARLLSAHTIPREARADSEYTLDPGRFLGFDVPTLVLAGSVSAVGFAPAARAVHAAITGSSLVVLEGHGHDAAITAPDVVAREVLEFVARQA